MTTHADKAARFLELHRQDRPLLLANAWDVGSAKLLAGLGYQALATTSSGYAASLGRLDYGVTRDEALAHAAALVAAADVPVTADLEECFAVERAGVAASELMSEGTYSFTELSSAGANAAKAAFAPAE